MNFECVAVDCVGISFVFCVEAQSPGRGRSGCSVHESREFGHAVRGGRIDLPVWIGRIGIVANQFVCASANTRSPGVWVREIAAPAEAAEICAMHAQLSTVRVSVIRCIKVCSVNSGSKYSNAGHDGITVIVANVHFDGQEHVVISRRAVYHVCRVSRDSGWRAELLVQY